MPIKKNISDNHKVLPFTGIFKRQLSLWEAVALIVSGTIGAGVLGIPYVVSKVGVLLGVIYIIGVGLLMMTLHLLLASVTLQTHESYQLVGLAEKYIGKWGKIGMSILFYTMLFGVMVIYIIGEGETLATLFNGNPQTWSLLFFAFAAVLVAFGLHTVKTIEVLLVLAILAVVVLLAKWGSPHVSVEHITYNNLANLLLPYGVILFAFHGVSAIPEAHALLRDKKQVFKQAVIISSIILMAIYAVFAVVVVGVTGAQTTEIATIGLGNVIGPRMLLFGNIFAALAMGTGFLLTGVALTDSLRWDMKISRTKALFLVCSIPLLIFLAGVRNFILVMDVIGGIFVSLELLLILYIYWRAHKNGDFKKQGIGLHHTSILLGILLVAFLVGAVYSIIKLI